MDMAAVIAPHTGDLNEWIDLSMPRYELYTAEDTEIKELARGNPAVVLLRDGKVVWKSTLTALDEEQFKSPENDMDIARLVTDGRDFLNRSIGIYIFGNGPVCTDFDGAEAHNTFPTSRVEGEI